MDMRLLEALDHPTRARAFLILCRHVASPKMIASQLGLPIGTVGHHIKQLEALGCIELLNTEPRRGATEHFYRASIPPPLFNDELWAMLSSDSKMAISVEKLKMIIEAFTEALVGRTFDARKDRHLSHIRARLDEQGWREITDLLGRTLQEVNEIESRSAEREEVGQSAGRLLEMNVVIAGFESPSQA